jgi:hypothetical protein
MVFVNRTAEFLRCVGELHEGTIPSAPPSIPNAFTVAARPLHNSIREMQALLTGQQKDYLNFNQHVISEASSMDDAQRCVSLRLSLDH